MISIVVASVLMFAGFLNSLGKDWMLQRVQAAIESDSTYVQKKFPDVKAGGGADEATRTKKDAEFKEVQKIFSTALMDSYVNNTFTIKVPFFGITFDVNDLGLIGGIALIVLLIMFRFSLIRELDNLEISFKEAIRADQLPTLYKLLAMRQVLTIPPTEGKEKVAIAMSIPKVLSFLPWAVLTAILGHDIATYEVGSAISLYHTIVIYIVGAALWAFALIVSIYCLSAWLQIDSTWRKYFRQLPKEDKPLDSAHAG
jgi:branched-subunit amino acid transport protein